MQTFGINLLVDLNFLIENKLTLDAWLLMYCLTNNKHAELIAYVENCSKLNKSTITDLEARGYLKLKTAEDYSLSSISVTSSGKALFVNSVDHEKHFEELFKQLRDTYPKRVPGENGSSRPLHGDLARCRRLYRKILTKGNSYDKELHLRILKAISKEVQERTKGRNLPFMQNLATYLHQQNYNLYLDMELEREVVRGDDI